MIKENFLWNAIKTGLIGGAVALFLCLIGMIEIFNKRDVIEDVITLGMFLLLATAFVIGFLAAQRTARIFETSKPFHQLAAGLLASAATGLVLSLFVLAGLQVNIRAVFLNASPGLYELLTFGRGLEGVWMLPSLGAAAGLAGAGFGLLPTVLKRPLTQAILFMIFMALFSGLFRVVMINQG